MAEQKLRGKTALITGAGRGIGKGIAVAFAREGARLILTSRTPEELVEAAAECIEAGALEAITCPADLSDESQLLELFEFARARFETLDLLVNNAGAFDGGPLDELSTEAWDKVMNLNVRAPFLCTREALKWMKPQQRGRIINLGSIAGSRVRPESAAYSASKHAIWGLTQVTALEGREYGVTCCCLKPGNIAVERRMNSGNPIDDEPMIAIEDIAEVALLMATLPPTALMLEATVLPHRQLYVGRG